MPQHDRQRHVGPAPGPNTPIDTDTKFDPATRKITFKLDWWEQIKCEVTNTRDTGTIKVTKKVVAPTGDTGKFNLLIDGAAKASNVGDGGTTGVQSVATGNHSVGETAGTGTSLANYAASTSCVDKAHPATPADTDGNVAVGKGDQWECVITNTRGVGTIKVTKALAPATDTGVFNLLIDGQAKATDVGDGGTTGVQTVLPGTHTVGEAAGTATDLANYDATLSCTDTAHTSEPADTDGSVQVDAGDAWECVIVNARKGSPPPPGDEPPTSQPPVQAVSPQIAVSPARVRPGQRTTQRSQRLPDDQCGGGQCVGSPDRQGDVLRRRQEGQDAHQGQSQRPVGAADEREALRLRYPPRAGDRPVRQVQPDQGQDAAVELQPLPLGRRHAEVHGLI